MASPTSTKKNMPYVRLGNSGLKISKIILGLMSYGSPEWQPWVQGEEVGLEHIKFAYDNGIQTFDTANIYSNGLSEEILGKAIKKFNLPREEIVVMTKLAGICAKSPSINIFRSGEKPDEVGYVNQYGLSRKHIFDAVKHSLCRLQLDYIDVLQCHRLDPEAPIEETMNALHDVVKAGYVRYIGMSSCYAWQFHVMQNFAIANKLTPFISMQNHYNLLYREEEREMIPTLKHFGVGCINWSPLARGTLCRPYAKDQTATDRQAKDPHVGVYFAGAGTPAIIERVGELSKRKGVSMAQIATAWNLSKDGVAAPVVGSTNLDNLKDILGAVHLKLTEEDIKYLEEPYIVQRVIGHS